MSNFIEDIVIEEFGERNANHLMQYSLMLKYLEKKTVSVDKDSKARGSFANLYAIYAVVQKKKKILSIHHMQECDLRMHLVLRGICPLGKNYKTTR